MDILEALAASEAVRHVTTRHEQGAAFMADVYGRLTGRAAVAMATLGPGRDEPRHRDRRRLPRPRADGRAHRPGGLRQAPQGGPPARRHRPDARAGHEVEPRGSSARRDPRDRAQGLPRGRSWRSPGPTHIELPENLAAMPRSDADAPARSSPTQAYFPEPTDEAIAHAARLLAGLERPIVLAGNGVLRRRRRAGAARLRARPARPGGGHVHGQGRDRRPDPPLADGRRAPGARSRPVGLRPRRPRGRRSATTSSSTRRLAGTRTGTSGSSTSTRSRPRSTPRTSRRWS